jgi:hypothetical protein
MKTKPFPFRLILFVLLSLFIIGFFALYVFYSPKTLILYLGVRNSFVILFFVSIVGAFTSMTKFSAYPMIVALVAGNMNYVYVGIVAGVGLAAGDILFFLFGYSARELTTHKWKDKLRNIVARLQRINDWLVQGLIFIYVGASPLPNNLLSGALAFTGYPFKKVVAPLVLGDLTFCMLVSWLAFRGINLFG